jgi:protein-disulfide isomerase
MMDLNDPVLIEIFADYTDPRLPDTWSRTMRVAAEFQHHRVVLRAPGASAEARRTLELAECARMANRFWQIRDALIEHSGPWGLDSLLAVGAAAGLDRNATRLCLGKIEVGAQLDKDRQHAEQRGILSFPAISIDRTSVADTDDAIRRAIRQSIMENSL